MTNNHMHINPIQTGIAVALALAVVIMFFILPGFSPFGQYEAVPSEQSQALQIQEQSTMSTDTQEITQLMMKDTVVGTGDAAESGDSVTVQYVGRLTNGTVFDASANHPETVKGFTFTLGAGQVIQGWDQGVAGMKEGGKRQLLIPASLAYGERAIGDVIPANSALIFDVELVKVEKGSR